MSSPFHDGKLWAWLLGAAAVLIAILYLLSCGGTRGPFREAARITRFTVEANCPDLMPVGECLEQIDARAKQADEVAGAALEAGR